MEAGKLKKRRKSDIVKERKFFRRCGECINCLKAECGECKHCLDMPKFGGTYKLKKACMGRECVVNKKGKEDPVIKEIYKKEKIRMLNNKLSVQYENGKVAKYVSGERMHNGKFIIIAHKQKENKDTFIPRPSLNQPHPPSQLRLFTPDIPDLSPDSIDLDIDAFVEKYLQVYYDDQAEEMRQEEEETKVVDRVTPEVDESRVCFLEDDVRFPSLMDDRVSFLEGERLEDEEMEDRLLPQGYGCPGLDTENTLTKELFNLSTICALCTLESKCGNCIINTALKEIGNLIET